MIIKEQQIHNVHQHEKLLLDNFWNLFSPQSGIFNPEQDWFLGEYSPEHVTSKLFICSASQLPSPHCPPYFASLHPWLQEVSDESVDSQRPTCQAEKNHQILKLKYSDLL